MAVSKLMAYRGAQEVGGTQMFCKFGDVVILLDIGAPMVSRHPGNWGSAKRPSKGAYYALEYDELPVMQGLLWNPLAMLEGKKGLYPTNRPVVDALVLSHAHLDHVGNLPYINPRLVLSDPPTRFNVEVQESAYPAPGFLNNLTRIRDNLVPAERRWATAMFIDGGERSWKHVPVPGQSVPKLEQGVARNWNTGYDFSVDGTEIKLYSTNHSIESVSMDIHAHESHMIYHADHREGRLTEAFIEKMRGSRPDYLIIEGTNVAKDKRGLTLDQLGSIVLRELASARGEWAIFLITQKDPFTTTKLIEAGNEHDRKILVTPKQAYYLLLTDKNHPGMHKNVVVMRYEDDDHLSSTKGEFDESRDPRMRIVGKKFHIVSDAEVRENPGRYMVLLNNQSKDWDKFMDLKPGAGIYVDTTTEPWDEKTRLEAQDRFDFVSLHAPNLRQSTVHVSGHAREDYLIYEIKEIAPKVVLIQHTDKEASEYYKMRIEKEVPGTNAFVLVRGETYDLVSGQIPLRTSEPITASLRRVELPPSQPLEVQAVPPRPSALEKRSAKESRKSHSIDR